MQQDDARRRHEGGRGLRGPPSPENLDPSSRCGSLRQGVHPKMAGDILAFNKFAFKSMIFAFKSSACFQA
jgi:hypothetical protein